MHSAFFVAFLVSYIGWASFALVGEYEYSFFGFKYGGKSRDGGDLLYIWAIIALMSAMVAVIAVEATKVRAKWTETRVPPMESEVRMSNFVVQSSGASDSDDDSLCEL